MVGSVELQLVDGSTSDALISIFMLGAYRRNGYAVPAIRLATDWVLGDLGLDAVWAAVRPNNKASVATFGGAGYRGCDGRTLPDGLKLPSDARMLVCDPINASEPAA